MIPRTTTRRLLRELPSRRASQPFSAIRPFATTPSSRAQIPPRPPQPSPQQTAAASAALQNLSHLTPAQITALLSGAGGPQHPHQQTPPQPSRRSVFLRRAFWAVVFFAAGYKLTSDQIWTLRIAGPFLYGPPDVPDEDLPLYRAQLTTLSLQESAMLGAMVPDVRRPPGDHISVWENWEPYGTFPPERRKQHLCAGALNTANALGLMQLVFRHKYTGELMVAIVFGQGTSGWPSVVHGGMLSTIMDEAMGRLAALEFPANTAVTANLAMDFKEPAAPGTLYFVRVNKALPQYQGDESKRDRKMLVFGRMEGPDGEVVCEARGLFVVPKGGNAEPLGKRF